MIDDSQMKLKPTSGSMAQAREGLKALQDVPWMACTPCHCPACSVAIPA